MKYVIVVTTVVLSACSAVTPTKTAMLTQPATPAVVPRQSL